MKIIILQILFAFTCQFFAQAQLIQYRFKDPVKLGGTVNSEAEEAMPVLSSDGKTLYFMRALSEQNTGGNKAGHDIWKADMNNGRVGSVTNQLGILNNEGNNAVVGISADGKTIYLLNEYKNKGKMKVGLSVAVSGGSGWSQPQPLKIPGLDIKGDFYGFWMNPEGDTLLISMNTGDSKGREDIYVCLKDEKGNWSKPLNLGSQINSYGYEISPFLDADGKTLFFASSGKGGYGSADIFVATRQDDSWTKWSYPRNLGKPLNSRGFDAYLIADGNTVYFSSDRGGQMGDIYTAQMFRLLPGQKLAEDIPEPKTVYFKINDYMLYPKQKKVLDEVAEAMNKDYDLKAVVSGYTCDIGDNKTNEKLSALRAESVMTYLVIKGIDQDRITVNHFGEAEAQKFNDTENDRALDRRVDIKFEF